MALVEYEQQGHVAVLTMNRPKQRNAINGPMAHAIEEAIDRVEGDDTVRVAILRAASEPGRFVFSAGHDLKGSGEDLHDCVTERGGFAGIARRQRHKPLIAAVDGIAAGGGCEIVLACDIVVASERSSFSLPEVRWNLVAGGGGLLRLPRIVGRIVACDMLLTGDGIPAERAYQLGMVSRLVPAGQVDDAAMLVALRIAQNGPLAVRLSRFVAAQAEQIDEDAGWALGGELTLELLKSNDVKEGINAFAEKRTPRFEGV